MVVVGQAHRLPATDAVALQLVRYATRAQQFVYFPAATGTWLSQDQSMVSKSVNYLVAEYRKSGKCNRHNMKTITLKPLILCLAGAGLVQIASAQSDL